MINICVLTYNPVEAVHCFLAGFSLTFKVEGHCVVSRQVPFKIEAKGPKPLGGSGGILPQEIFKT